MAYSNDLTGWAQSGYIYFPSIGNNCMSHFAQQAYNYPNVAPTTAYGSCVSDNEAHQAWQQTILDNGNWKIRSNIDVTIFLQSTWSQFVVWQLPIRLANQGESFMGHSDIPGTPSLVNDWSSIQVQSYSNDAFYWACGHAVFRGYNNWYRYSINQPSCQETQSWTSSPNG